MVPFVGLVWEKDRLCRHTTLSRAVAVRDEFATWLVREYDVPVFLYGPLEGGQSRTLPQIRSQSFREVLPDVGPQSPNSEVGAVCVGARDYLVAFNLWLHGLSYEQAQSLARTLRSEKVRTMAFSLNGAIQLSANLIAPFTYGPAQFIADARSQLPIGAAIEFCELVGLVPGGVVEAISHEDQIHIGIDHERSIESVLNAGRSARFGFTGL